MGRPPGGVRGLASSTSLYSAPAEQSVVSAACSPLASHVQFFFVHSAKAVTTMGRFTLASPPRVSQGEIAIRMGSWSLSHRQVEKRRGLGAFPGSV